MEITHTNSKYKIGNERVKFAALKAQAEKSKKHYESENTKNKTVYNDKMYRPVTLFKFTYELKCPLCDENIVAPKPPVKKKVVDPTGED
jgi:hypothetical protein